MFVYNFLFFPQHDLDIVMFQIQILVIQKFNENVVIGSLPLNFK